jgi:hypothetical protein
MFVSCLSLRTSRWQIEIHVTVLSKTQVWSRLFAGVAESNLARSHILFTYMALVSIDCSDREVDSRLMFVSCALHTSRWSVEIHVTVWSKTLMVAVVAASNLARGMDVRVFWFTYTWRWSISIVVTAGSILDWCSSLVFTYIALDNVTVLSKTQVWSRLLGCWGRGVEPRSGLRCSSLVVYISLVNVNSPLGCWVRGVESRSVHGWSSLLVCLLT